MKNKRIIFAAKTGMKFCVVYSVIAVPLLGIAALGDIKWQVVFTQFAVMPVTALLVVFNLLAFVTRTQWLNNIFVLFALNLALVYSLGALLGLLLGPRKPN